MGTLYVVVPLNSEAAEWLDSEGIDHPACSPKNRNPTPSEIEKVLAGLSDYKFEISRDRERRTWYADVFWAQNRREGPWTEIAVRDYRGDQLPHEFSFTRGWQETILLVTERLSHSCGPLVITDSACTLPFLVQPGMELKTMIAGYNARYDSL